MEVVKFGVWKTPSYNKTEAVRTLRTNIQFCGDDIKSIVFTSCVQNEGKSTVVMDLARSVAESGKKVLVVDADIRKSVMAGRMRASSKSGNPIYGLSHYLSGQKKLRDVLCIAGQEKYMHIIFAGPSVPNPTEILGNHYFEELMAFARENYDMVLVDCAPLGMVIDAAVAAKSCDGAVLVVSQGTAGRKDILEVKGQLEASGVKILGAVLNKVDISRAGYYGYGKYYGHYGRYGKYYGRYGKYYGRYEEYGGDDAKE